MTKLLICGLATDGGNDVFLPLTETSLMGQYGAGYVQRQFITSTSSALSLDYAPWLPPTNYVNSFKNWLYSPVVSGSTYYFGNIGSSGQILLDLIYTPYLGMNDLIFAARKYYEQTNTLPYVARVGGTQATLSVSGFSFISVYSGNRYNKLSVTFFSSGLTIGGLDPQYPTTSYTGTTSQIVQMMFNDYTMGLCPAMLRSYPVDSIPIPSTGPWDFIGGSDGSYTDLDVDYILNTIDIPGEVTHVLFLSPLTSSMCNSVNTYYTSAGSQPRVFYFPSPSYSSPSSSWISTAINTLPSRNNMICSVIQNTDVALDGKIVTRYGIEAAAIAFDKYSGYNVTNMPIAAENFSPYLSQTAMDALTAAGFMSITRHIRSDVSVYQGVTTANQNTFLFSSKVAEICGMANTYCSQFYGHSLQSGDQPAISTALLSILNQIQFLTINDVNVTVIDDAMLVNVDAYLPNEILTISFIVNNQGSSSSS